jgi:hypothetical protein
LERLAFRAFFGDFDRRGLVTGALLSTGGGAAPGDLPPPRLPPSRPPNGALVDRCSSCSMVSEAGKWNVRSIGDESSSICLLSLIHTLSARGDHRLR